MEVMDRPRAMMNDSFKKLVNWLRPCFWISFFFVLQHFEGVVCLRSLFSPAKTKELKRLLLLHYQFVCKIDFVYDRTLSDFITCLNWRFCNRPKPTRCTRHHPDLSHKREKETCSERSKISPSDQQMNLLLTHSPTSWWGSNERSSHDPKFRDS